MLVCLPYWDGDWPMMREVALLLSDLLLDSQPHVELMFAARFDAKVPDTKIIQHCEQKFAKVHVFRCHRKGVGFPMGCNEMAFSIFDHVHYHHEHQFPLVDCMLFVESDCVMLSRTWNTQLFEEWKKASALNKSVCGAFIQGNYHGGEAHVNAVAMYSWDVIKQIPALIGASGNEGWDWWHGTNVIPKAMDTPLIYLDYRRDTISVDDLFAPRKQGKVPVLYHGVKDKSAIEAVRKQFSL